jgi:hypothetical protein
MASPHIDNILPYEVNKMKRIYLKSIGIWFLLAIVAIINGSLRNFTYGNFMPELTAHQISCLTGLILFGIVYFIFLRTHNEEYTGTDLLKIGSLWFFMTLVFEFIFGHYIIGHPWSRLLFDYNIFNGRLWILMLIWTWMGPYIIGNLVKGRLHLNPFMKARSSKESS